MSIPPERLQDLNDAPVREDGAYVLYWMIAARRTRWNLGLERAVERARSLGKPLVVFEPLRAGYRWASDRHHRFVIEGMRDNRDALADRPVTYLPYVEPAPGEGAGLLERLAQDAALVVTDESPMFFLPRMLDAAAAQLDVRLEAVDGNGILPLRAPDKAFARAHDFRRHLHAVLPEHLNTRPRRDPLARVSLPAATLAPEIGERWQPADLDALLAPAGLDDLPIDHAVRPVEAFPGGPVEGARRLKGFLGGAFGSYADARGQVDVSSGLSPYLHFGHVGAHQVLDQLLRHEGWSADRIDPSVRGKRAGWWGLSADGETFVDQLITWRELGAQSAYRRGDFGTFAGLPEWARNTLARHAGDARPHRYELADFESAATHDEIWNAAQRQLVGEGRIENYLRMLWGKKILHWSPDPEAAFEVMVELNHKYALDGRDPNSDAGIGWVLGLFDRPWGPEREVFGTIRYMTSDSTRRKLRLGDYLERWSGEATLF